MRLDEITQISESAKYEVSLVESRKTLKEGEFYFTGKSKETGADKIWKFGDMSYEEAELMANKFGSDIQPKLRPGGTLDDRHSNFVDYEGPDRRVRDLGRDGRSSPEKKFS